MAAQAINGLLRHVPAWPLYIIGALPAAWLWYLGLTGGLGADPIKTLERELGEVALQLLIAGLTVTPLRRYLGLNLIRYRRAIGLLSFFYVAQHFAVWLILDIGILNQIWEDIIKRPYVTVGFLAFLGMIPLALTSNNWSVRRLGALRWRRLHQLTYFVVLGGAVHYLWLYKAKALVSEPMLYLAVILLLLILRAIPQTRRVAA